MNRKERRRYIKYYTKKLRNYGFNREQRKGFAQFQLEKMTSESLYEGDKVTIDYEKVINYPDYKDKVSGFKETIEKLKDKICTVKYDSRYSKNDPFLVCLEEDEHEPKWLFARTDLILKERALIKPATEGNSQLAKETNTEEENAKN